MELTEPAPGKYTIYKATSKCGYVYIGMTGRALTTRISAHVAPGKLKSVFQLKLNELGKGAFLWEALATTDDKGLATELESIAILSNKDLHKEMCLNVCTKASSVSGEDHCNYDHTVYTFAHEDHGVMHSTKYKFRTAHGISRQNIGRLFRGEYKSIRGWRLVP